MVNRSIIGRHVALSSGTESELISTTAQLNQVVGIGEIAGEIGIEILDMYASGISSSECQCPRGSYKCSHAAVLLLHATLNALGKGSKTPTQSKV